jgi:Bacterial virulence protein (VirJ)
MRVVVRLLSHLVTRAGTMRRVAVTTAGLATLVSCGCVHGPILHSPQKPVEFVRSIALYDHPLDLHLARPSQLQPGTPLLLYATGDGGWHGKDVDTYRRLIRWGYPVAGFSAPSYLNNLGFVSDTTTPVRLAMDYRRLIEFAKQTLSLPSSTRTVLVGVSRGAGLAVVAAGRPELNAELGGVLAVALTKEEEYVRHYKVVPGRTPSDMPTRELVEFQTYQSLDRLRDLPLVVVQSTGDDYLPAAAARKLFGADTGLRRFVAIESRDHSFDGARDALYAQMADALTWMSKMPALRATPAK